MGFINWLESRKSEIRFSGWYSDGRIIIYIDGKRYEYITDALYHKQLRKQASYAPWKTFHDIKRIGTLIEKPSEDDTHTQQQFDFGENNFKEFIKYWEQDWHLNPHHVFFQDPNMSKFLTPEELRAMNAIEKRSNRKIYDEPGLTRAYAPHKDEPGLTRAYAPHKDEPGLTKTHVPYIVNLSRDLEEVKRRLSRLEKSLSS